MTSFAPELTHQYGLLLSPIEPASYTVPLEFHVYTKGDDTVAAALKAESGAGVGEVGGRLITAYTRAKIASAVRNAWRSARELGIEGTRMIASDVIAQHHTKLIRFVYTNVKKFFSEQ